MLGQSQGSNVYLCSQVRDADELLQDVLGQDVGVARLLDVVRRNVDVVCPQMEVGSRYSPEVWEVEKIKIVSLNAINANLPKYFYCNYQRKKYIYTIKSLIWPLASLPDPPFGLGGEGLRLVVGGGGGDDLVAVLVDGAGLGGGELGLLLGLLLDLSDLLALLGGSGYLHTQDDVSDLRLGEGGHVHAGEEQDGRRY